MKTLEDTSEYAQYWLIKALQWADERWNDEFALVQMQLDRKSRENVSDVYAVRDSVWYATGLLMRQSEGDVERALRIIEAVISYQFDEPSAVYHGTFARYPGEPHPPNDSIIWKDYDPNWREFICTVFIILVKEFPDLLPNTLQDKMRQAIRLAAEGSYERKVAPEYTNISLMSAFLLDYAGDVFNKPVWRDYARSQAQEIYRLFNRYKTFDEYNSPTYYGVDFYALALWREYGLTEMYRDMGAEMEAELWRDTAQFYHAGLRNICGPYDRSYGMDMTQYIALVGLWIAATLPKEYAPLPDVDTAFDHAGDYYFVPLVALLGSKPPEDVLVHLKDFQGERLLERTVEPNRTVTAWLSDDLMLGAEADNLNSTRTDQFHPATAHWQAPDGSVAWIRTRCENLIQATARPHELRLTSDGHTEYVFELHASGAELTMIDANRWQLPGMTIHIERPTTPFMVEQQANTLVVRFEASEVIRLRFLK